VHLQLERVLAPLVGLRVWGPGRDSNMLSLRFGDPPAGGHALRVYCAWRLSRGDVVLAGSADLFTPADPDEDLETFDYEEPGATWWDVRMAAALGAGPGEGPAVTAVAADALGGLRLALDDGAVFEVFPNSAPAEHFETEFWRLVRAEPAEPHVVVGLAG
jgi:hypothetical protein